MIFFSPISCTLYIFAHHLKKKKKKKKLKHANIFCHQTTKTTCRWKMFNIFLIMFNEKSFENPNFDKFFHFQICSNEGNKIWSWHLLKNIMLNVISKCSYDFLEILLKLDYNFMNQFKVCLQDSCTCHSTLEFFIPCLTFFIVHYSHANEPWIIYCLVLIVDFSFVIQLFLFEFCSWNFRCHLLCWMSTS
jgi:hypothetical protein